LSASTFFRCTSGEVGFRGRRNAIKSVRHSAVQPSEETPAGSPQTRNHRRAWVGQEVEHVHTSSVAHWWTTDSRSRRRMPCPMAPSHAGSRSGVAVGGESTAGDWFTPDSGTDPTGGKEPRGRCAASSVGGGTRSALHLRRDRTDLSPTRAHGRLVEFIEDDSEASVNFSVKHRVSSPLRPVPLWRVRLLAARVASPTEIVRRPSRLRDTSCCCRRLLAPVSWRCRAPGGARPQVAGGSVVHKKAPTRSRLFCAHTSTVLGGAARRVCNPGRGSGDARE